MRALDIGAGHNPFRPFDKNWLHNDIKKLDHIEFACDSRDLNPIWCGKFDALRASHTLEHIEWQEIEKTLKGWHELLEPHGYLDIIVPHFDNLLADWQRLVGDGEFEGKVFEQTLQRLLGYGIDETDKHRVLLNQAYLHWLLGQAGFVHVEDLPSGDISVRAWMQPDPTPKPAVATPADNNAVGEIEGRSFFITNTSGWGDILATTCAIHELKKRGAKWITLATRCWDDFSILRSNQDIDYICTGDRTDDCQEMVSDRLGKQLYREADYRIYQSNYRDNHQHGFYEARLVQVGLDPAKCDCRGHIDLDWHILPDLKDHWLPGMGLEPDNYIALHHQASHKSRSWHISHVFDFCRLCAEAGIKVVIVGQGSPLAMEERGIFNWTHQKSFDSAAGLVKLCKAVVCTDSAFSHIAHAFEKPLVCLYSDAPPEFRLAPHANRIISLRGQPGQADGIADISADTVFSALHTFIGGFKEPYGGY